MTDIKSLMQTIDKIEEEAKEESHLLVEDIQLDEEMTDKQKEFFGKKSDKKDDSDDDSDDDDDKEDKKVDESEEIDETDELDESDDELEEAEEAEFQESLDFMQKIMDIK